MEHVTAPLSLKRLLRDLKDRTKLSFEEIGEAAGVKDVKKGQAVYTALNRNENISFTLADWVLNNTFGGTTPLERAFNALGVIGLNEFQFGLIKGVIEQMLLITPSTVQPVAPVIAPEESSKQSDPHSELESLRTHAARLATRFLAEDPVQEILLKFCTDSAVPTALPTLDTQLGIAALRPALPSNGNKRALPAKRARNTVSKS